MSNKPTWAPIIPLIGGFPTGAEMALGTLPEAIVSYEAFATNDGNYINYMNNKRGLNIPVILVDKGQIHTESKIDIFVSTCPCAGLSMLNTGKDASKRGADAEKNKWMYDSSRHILETYRPKVLVGENAPALATSKGEAVADKLYKIAKEYNYSFTIYKTNTIFHGVPQSRERTFYFFWDSKTAPIMEYYDRPRKSFSQYLNEVEPGSLQHDDIINPKLMSEPQYRFIKDRYKTDDARKIISQRAVTAHNFIIKNDLFNEYVEWVKINGTESDIKSALYAKSKFDNGLGIWDSSIHVFGDYMNAVIGRNMNDTIHPTEDRSLTVREAMHMMALPPDFELLGGRKNTHIIAQNVPACTARDMVLECEKFINGKLEFSDVDYLRQNNSKKEVITKNYIKNNQLDEFFS
jgi:DNA (cytosine-5)-methyltransferase 1